MKATLLLAIFLAFTTGLAQAQLTVSTDPGYASQTFYNLEDDSTWKQSKNNWDLAFGMTFSAPILANTAKGVTVYKVTNTDITGYLTLDTTGHFTSYPVLDNSVETWDVGAFNKGIDPTNPFDLGWGVYSMITHHVLGDSLFIIALPDTSSMAQPGAMIYKKFMIDRLAGGKFSFRFANLDGTQEVVDTVDKALFRDDINNRSKNFGYYNLLDQHVLDTEPFNDEWDLLFTQYNAPLPQGPYYTVSGVLSNAGVEVMELADKDTASVGSLADTSLGTFSTSISEIGYDWKSFDLTTFSWQLQDSLVYLVKSQEDNIYKLIFTSFGGSSNGNFIFTKELLGPLTSIAENTDGMTSFLVWPNPATSELNLSASFTSKEQVELSLMDLSGKIWKSQQLSASESFVNERIDVSALPRGMYLLNVRGRDFSTSQKVIIN